MKYREYKITDYKLVLHGAFLFVSVTFDDACMILTGY